MVLIHMHVSNFRQQFLPVDAYNVACEMKRNVVSQKVEITWKDIKKKHWYGPGVLSLSLASSLWETGLQHPFNKLGMIKKHYSHS